MSLPSRKLSILIVVLLSLFSSVPGISQDLSARLKKHMWYVTGQLLMGDRCLICVEKRPDCSGYLNFVSDTELDLYVEDTTTVKGTDRTIHCKYETHKNKLKVTFAAENGQSGEKFTSGSCFEVSELKNGHDFVLNPIFPEDYN